MTWRTACRAALFSVSMIVITGCSSQDAADKGEKPNYFADQRQTETARVEAIEPTTRTITLRNDAGNVDVFKVDKDVRNLDQVKVGDHVAVDYYESVAIKVLPPGEPVNNYSASADRSKPGEKPGGAATKSITLTGTVESIDKGLSRVNVRGPSGQLRAITLRDKKKLENIHVGDRMQLTYTESLAVSVEPAP